MTEDTSPRPPLTEHSAEQLARRIEAAWNSRDPDLVAEICAADVRWVDRGLPLAGHEAVSAYLQRKWRRELHQQVTIRVLRHTAGSLSLEVTSEWQHARTGQWYRTTAVEQITLDAEGLLQSRSVTGDDEPISSSDRRISRPRA